MRNRNVATVNSRSFCDLGWSFSLDDEEILAS